VKASLYVLAGMLGGLVLAAVAAAVRPSDDSVRQAGTPAPGLQLAFTRRGFSEDEHDDEIRLVGLDGHETHVASDAAHPAWSPDGAQIAFERKIDADVGRQDEIWVMYADGSGSRRLTYHAADDHDPAWAPDGERILFVRSLALYGVPADGRRPAALLAAGGEDDDVALSPDGRRLAFSRAGDVWTARADGSDLRRLTVGSRTDNEPAWSPDGRRIVFGSDGDIWVMDADGSDRTALTSDAAPEELADGEPDWSPDGRWIAFERSPIVGCSCHHGIWIMDASGRNLRQATTGDDADPKWNPRATVPRGS
jgi:TolB protein